MPDFKFPDVEGEGKTTSLIGPGAENHSTIKIEPIPEAQFQALFRGEQVIYVWGRLDYTDAFKISRHFTYRLTASGPLRKVQTYAGGWALAHVKEGPDAD